MNTTLSNNDGPSVPALAGWWQRKTIQMNGKLNRPLSPKELGQLKLLKKSLGKWTLFVIEWTWDNWSAFSEDARIGYFLSSVPFKPHIGFLLKYVPAAIDLMDEAAHTAIAVTPNQIAFKHSVEELKSDFVKQLDESFEGFADKKT